MDDERLAAEHTLLTNDFAMKAATGNAEAFESLYERVAPALEGWVRVHLRGAHRALADDVSQEIWSRVFRSLSTFDPGRGSFRRWVFGVASHALTDACRRAATRRKHESPSPETHQLEGITNHATSIGLRAARRDGLDAFLARMESLSDDEQDLVAHLGLEGLTVPETAERLELSVSATQKRWDRLRTRMREWSMPEGLLDW